MDAAHGRIEVLVATLPARPWGTQRPPGAGARHESVTALEFACWDTSFSLKSVYTPQRGAWRWKGNHNHQGQVQGLAGRGQRLRRLDCTLPKTSSWNSLMYRVDLHPRTLWPSCGGDTQSWAERELSALAGLCLPIADVSTAWCRPRAPHPARRAPHSHPSLNLRLPAWHRGTHSCA